MKTPLRRLALLAGLLTCTALSRAQVPTWTKSTPADVTAAGIGVQLTGVDYGNGTFVLAAYFGTTTPAAYTSPDGVTWTRRTLSATGTTGAPRFLNGKFLLGVTPSSQTGGNGVILSSTDGATWTSSASLGATINAPNEFTFGNGLYAGPCATSSAQALTSPDGVTWTGRQIVAGGSSSHITFFKGKFYSSVYGNASIAGLYSSSDAITWTKLAGAPVNPGILAASDSTLIVTYFSGNTSGQYVSSDGVTFTAATPGITLQTETIKYINNAFTVTASPSPSSFDLNLARASYDGLTWVTIGSTTNVNYANEVAFGGGRYVFVGEFNVFSGSTTILPGGTSSGGGGNSGGTTAPAITTAPVAQTGTVGGSITFSVVASGTGNLYQWYLNNVAIVGATNASYIIAALTAANAGSYTVTITNSGGSITSSAAVLTVNNAPSTPTTAGYLSNLSIRARAGTGDQTMIVGLNIGGAGTSGAKALLARAVGPTLTNYGISGMLADPVLTVSGAANTSNDDWNNDAQVTSASAATGAFALAASSKDAALFTNNATAGTYNLLLTGKAGATGLALLELYDATPTSAFTTATPRFVNFSARAFVGTGDNILITGFAISGTTPRKVLIRAVGPTLANYGLTSALADPTLAVFNGNTKVAENDNWDASTATAQAQSGAFALAAGSKDAVIVTTLNPGVYSIQVSGVAASTGVALIELYEAP